MQNLQALAIPRDKALDVFTEKGGLDPILRKIKDEADSFIPDPSTKKGRDEIVSLAHKVAKSKSYLDSVGKKLVVELKRKPKLVDESRKAMRDFLDNLKQEVREPLTTIEARESNITNNINALTDDIEQLSVEDLSVRRKTLLDISLAEVVILIKEITLLLRTAVAKVDQLIKSKLAEQEKLAVAEKIAEEIAEEHRKYKLEAEKIKQDIASEQAKIQAERNKLELEKLDQTLDP